MIEANPSSEFDAGSVRTPFKSIYLIVNPAAGQDQPILKTANTLFQHMGIDWEIFVTKRAGDARHFARAAVEASVDAVAVYGGDGTILEVANGLYGSEIPILILPGGTANVLAIEMGIPWNLGEALLLLAENAHTIRKVDMGRINEALFFHLSVGLHGEAIKRADRAAKDRAGMLAYVFSVLAEMQNPAVIRYKMMLDDEFVEVDGINCMVTTFGSTGIGNLKLSHTIDTSDGLLDVIVIRAVNLQTVLAAIAGAITSGEVSQTLLQWQVRKVAIEADPPQTVICDGELTEIQRIQAEVVPQAVKIIIPATGSGQSQRIDPA